VEGEWTVRTQAPLIRPDQPATLVHSSVMVTAEQQPIDQVGLTALGPWHQVVRIGVY
jgi:hypothetical protein